MSLKIQIAVESKFSWDLLKFKIESISEHRLEYLEHCLTVEQTVGAIFMHQPDILVFDLKVFGNNEFDVIERLMSQKTYKPKIIVIASQSQLDQIKRIIEIGAAALVTKPINNEDLGKAINRVIGLIKEGKKEEHSEHFITLKSNRSMLYLNQRDILFVESNRNICGLTLIDGSYKTVNENITSIDQRLNIRDLIRIDKSTIINASKIVFLNSDGYNKECKLRLSNGTEISKSLSKIGMGRLYKVVSSKVKNDGRIIF